MCHFHSEYAVEKLSFQISCLGNNLKCAKNFEFSLGDEGKNLSYAKDANGIERKCRQRCEMQDQTLIPTSANYPNPETFHYRLEFCIILKKVVKICQHPTKKLAFIKKYRKFYPTCENFIQDSQTLLRKCEDPKIKQPIEDIKKYPKIIDILYKYANDNIAILKIYIRDPYYTKIIKAEAISFTSFVSNIGGLASLCLGLSAVSFFEIFYHCFKFASDSIILKCE